MLTMQEARTLIARVRSDITFLKSIPPGKVITDQLNPAAASNRLREVVDNLTTFCDAVDPDREAEEAPDAGVASGKPETEGGSDVLTDGAGATETAPQEPAPTSP